MLDAVIVPIIVLVEMIILSYARLQKILTSAKNVLTTICVCMMLGKLHIANTARTILKVEIESNMCVNFVDKSEYIIPPCKINSHIFVIPT